MEKVEKPHRTVWSRLKRYLLAGTIVTAPVFITLYTVIGVINIADRWIKSLLPHRFYPDMRFFGIPGIGLILLLVLLVVIGYLTASWLGRILVDFTDKFFAGAPVVSGVYKTLKQLFQSFLGENTNSFRQVVLAEFPRPGCWSVGFVTGQSEDATAVLGDDMVYVFIPTTPNPTNGFLVLLPRTQLRNSTMTVEQGLKAVVSMGMSK